MKIKKVGLMGYGRFGRMVYGYLRHRKQCFVYDCDQEKLKGIEDASSFQEAACADAILLCVPISAVAETCKKLTPYLREGQLIVDTCSVKKRPVEWMLAHLPVHVQVLGTHPLFGPDSGKEGIAGLKIAICPVRIDRDLLRAVHRYLESLQLVVIETTPEEHDQQIARSQAIFHLIAQSIKELGWSGQAISTPGPDIFYRLVRTVQHDTDQLFLDMERVNPYAPKYRELFIKELMKLHEELSRDAGERE